MGSRLRGSTCCLFNLHTADKTSGDKGKCSQRGLHYSLSVTQYFLSIPQRIANILLTLFKGSPKAFSRLSQRVRGYMWPFRLHFPPSKAFAFLMIKKNWRHNGPNYVLSNYTNCCQAHIVTIVPLNLKGQSYQIFRVLFWLVWISLDQEGRR